IHLKTDSRYLHEYTKALVQQNNLKIICCSTDVYKEAENTLQPFPKELTTVQTFYEQYFLKMGLPITYLSFQISSNEPIKEPVWESDYWLGKENEGRILGRIR
ncbi:MAG: hypothetical protein IK042_02715, partial [Bacteroidales bacterium]|nr:hypothetical protein [Bacteroidales bacterium]